MLGLLFQMVGEYVVRIKEKKKNTREKGAHEDAGLHSCATK